MPPKKNMRTKDAHLVWTDDKVQLLLETRDFKTKKTYTGVEWESIKDKYENIRYRYSESFRCFSLTIFVAIIIQE